MPRCTESSTAGGTLERNARPATDSGAAGGLGDRQTQRLDAVVPYRQARMGRRPHRHAVPPTLVIIKQIDIRDILLFKAKNDAPISPYPSQPTTPSIRL